MKVAVFIGHGISSDSSWDSGCVYRHKGKLYTEAELMAKVTESCVYYLRQCGITVITDAPKNRINMNRQIAMSNAENVKLHVAFHCNYSGQKQKGTMPLYASEKGRKLAALMNKRVMQYTSLKTLGLKRRPDLSELARTNAPAVIFECGGIKCDLVELVRQYDAIGFGAARGICDYLGVKFDPIQMQLLNACTYYEKQILSHHLKYSGSATYTTFRKSLLGKKLVNCALYITWALQRIKVLPTNRRIWLGNGVNGNGASTLKKKSKVMHPNKKPRWCYLHIGDICGWQWGSSKKNLVHTMVFRGFLPNGKPKWATCGGSDIKAKDLSRRRTTYEKKPIKTICRLK